MAFSIQVTLRAKTDKAILVVDDEDNEVWIPESQIDDDSEIWSSSEVGDEGKLVIPEWLARKKGW